MCDKRMHEHGAMAVQSGFQYGTRIRRRKMDIQCSLESIPERLLFPLFGRAMMSESAHPLLDNRFAVDLVKRFGHV